VVAIEATTGWRWVWRELIERGFEVRLAEPVQARGLLGRRRSAKTDRLDARWLARAGSANSGASMLRTRVATRLMLEE
jgi:transposase